MTQETIFDGIAEEARRADAAASTRWRRYQARYSLKRMYADQNNLLLQAVGKGDCLLEVGVGIGNFLVDATTRMAGWRIVHGVEVGYETARLAWSLAPDTTSLSLAPAEQLPFRSESIDAVVARGVLHHPADPGAGLAEMYRVLRPGGRLVILEGNPASRYRRLALKAADTLHVPHEDTQYRHLMPNEIVNFLVPFRQVDVRPVNGLFAPLAYVGVGGRTTWRMLDGIARGLRRFAPQSFDWWRLWTAYK